MEIVKPDILAYDEVALTVAAPAAYFVWPPYWVIVSSILVTGLTAFLVWQGQ